MNLIRYNGIKFAEPQLLEAPASGGVYRSCHASEGGLVEQAQDQAISYGGRGVPLDGIESDH